jgi:CHAT domain-containing protein
MNITDKREKINAKKHLVIGDPTGDLPHAQQEAKMVAQQLGCEALVGITRQRFLDTLKSSQYDIIHYAGHGRYTETGLHALVFSDGEVTADDMLSVGVSANVINIAACWSSMTTFSVWNELEGFIRVLLMSGVRNIIGSVYPLGDKAGEMFATTYYQEYLAGARPSKAFQSSIAALSRKMSVPLWGGLMLVGQR